MFIVSEENINASDFQTCCILSREERVDEIINEVCGEEYSEGSHISGLEVAICISKVAGMSDNIIHKEQLIKSQTYWRTLRPFRVNSIISYFPYLQQSIIMFTPEKKYGPDYLIDNTYGYKWILNDCTIENTIKMAARCINVEENPIDILLKYSLCDTDMYNRMDEFISIKELKEILCRMMDIAGGLYFISDLDKQTENGVETNKDGFTYYDKYINRMTFKRVATDTDGQRIRCITNKNNRVLISLRDYFYSLGMSVKWTDGQIFIEGKDESYILCLDNFSNNSEIKRMLVDKSVYVQEKHIDKNKDDVSYDTEKEYTYLGQYIMIEDTVYLYPQTYKRINEYLQSDNGQIRGMVR